MFTINVAICICYGILYFVYMNESRPQPEASRGWFLSSLAMRSLLPLEADDFDEERPVVDSGRFKWRFGTVLMVTALIAIVWCRREAKGVEVQTPGFATGLCLAGKEVSFRCSETRSP